MSGAVAKWSSVREFIDARERELADTRARLAEVTRQLKELQLASPAKTARPTKCLMCDEPYGDSAANRCGRKFTAKCGHEGFGRNCCNGYSGNTTAFCDNNKQCLITPPAHRCFACRATANC